MRESNPLPLIGNERCYRNTYDAKRAPCGNRTLLLIVGSNLCGHYTYDAKKRSGRIELPSSPWKGDARPLCQPRKKVARKRVGRFNRDS